MRQAIKTIYNPPTDHRGPRITATCPGGKRIIHWDTDIDSDGNHINAAKALLITMNWDKEYILVGGILNDNECCFVLKSKKEFL